MVRQKSSFVLFGVRILLAALAAAAAVAGFVATRTAPDRQSVATASYACPMHPEVTSSGPGECSICGMALEPSGRAAVDTMIALVSSAQPAAPHRYVCPMHPDQTSPTPAKCRICKMPMKRVDAGSSAEHEHGDEHEGHGAAGAVSPPKGAAVFSFHDVSRVRPRSSSRDMKAPAWLETSRRGAALYYKDEVQLLKPAEKGLFFPTTRPTDGAPAGIEVELTAEPATPWDGATELVHFELSAESSIAAKQTGWLKLPTRMRNELAVPASAVIQSPDGPYVLVLSEDLNSVAKRMITIGSVLFGYASVISGLRDGERVAAMRTFSLDALRKQRQP